MVISNDSRSAAKQLQAITRSRVEVPWAEQWTVVSAAGQRKYRIFAAKPLAPPPASGYPVIYVLDANSIFGTVVEALRLQSGRPEKTGVVPALIIGIGYDTEDPFSPERFYDYTPEPTDSILHRFDGTSMPEQGGASSFLQFIEEELKVLIEEEYPVDRSRQTIFGHSLGGLFVLYTLFTKPDSFRYYVAGSPSLHWNERLMSEEEQRFINRLARSDMEEGESLAPIEVLLGMGELENTHITRNSERARALADRLSAHAALGVKAEYAEYAGEGHVSVLPVLINRALRLALSPNPGS